MASTILVKITTEWTSRLQWIAAAFLCYVIALVYYRLFFSPLAGFPGSKVAAATAWYEFYYDVIHPGRFYYKIAEMHDRYGPIIRINPWELSVRDGSFYSTLYVSGAVRRTQIFPRYMAGIGIDGSVPVSEDHRLHRHRRKGLEPFFSRKGIQARESLIVSELEILEQRLLETRGTGTILDMEQVFSAITGDIMGKISVPNPPAFVLDSNFSPDWHKTMRSFFPQALLYTQLTFLMGWMQYIPLSMLLRLIPGAGAFRSFVDLVTNHAENSMNRRINGQIADNDKHLTLMEHTLMSEMPEEEKTIPRLTAEFIAILSAGTGTTARTLATITYFVLADSSIEMRLRESLSDIMSGYPEQMPKIFELEKIPYLVGCVKEGLRLSHGTMRRLPRCAPDVALQYGKWTIPKGTPVGMSAYMMHNDSEIYPAPLKFIPDRWVGHYDPLMDRNFVPFCKGSRNCLGMNLAYAELYIAIAVLFRPNGPRMSLFETDETDVLPIHDFFLAVPKLSTKGMRVVLH